MSYKNEIPDLKDKITERNLQKLLCRFGLPGESFQARRDAEKIIDIATLRLAMSLVKNENDKNKRSSLYFIIGKISLNISSQKGRKFLIRRSQIEKLRDILHFLLDRIADLPVNDYQKKETDILIEHSYHRWWQVKVPALEALGKINHPSVEKRLIEVINVECTNINKYEIETANCSLRLVGTKNSILALEKHINSRRRDVKYTAIGAIEEIYKRELMTKQG